MTRRFTSAYGSGPLHLLANLAALAVAAYVVVKLADNPGRWELLVWFLGSAVLYDLLLFPLTTLLDRIAQGRRPRAAVNYVRIPVVLSGALLLVSLGLVLDRAPETYERATGVPPEPYLERWLAITAVLFLASGLVFAVRARARRAAEPQGTTQVARRAS